MLINIAPHEEPWPVHGKMQGGMQLVGRCTVNVALNIVHYMLHCNLRHKLSLDRPANFKNWMAWPRLSQCMRTHACMPYSVSTS